MGGFDGETDDDDGVELEKSNVLLMGPTGSGKHLPPNSKLNADVMGTINYFFYNTRSTITERALSTVCLDTLFVSQVKLYLLRH